MDKTVYTSGTYAFEAFDDEGILYSAQRIKEFIPLKVSNLSANQQKTVKLNHPSINSDLIFTQLRINKTVTTDLSLTIDIYRGSDFIDRIILTDVDLPYEFNHGCVLDPHGHDFTNNQPIELRFTANKAIDAIYIICEKCYVYPVLELLTSY